MGCPSAQSSKHDHLLTSGPPSPLASLSLDPPFAGIIRPPSPQSFHLQYLEDPPSRRDLISEYQTAARCTSAPPPQSPASSSKHLLAEFCFHCPPLSQVRIPNPEIRSFIEREWTDSAIYPYSGRLSHAPVTPTVRPDADLAHFTVSTYQLACATTRPPTSSLGVSDL